MALRETDFGKNRFFLIVDLQSLAPRNNVVELMSHPWPIRSRTNAFRSVLGEFVGAFVRL